MLALEPRLALEPMLARSGPLRLGDYADEFKSDGSWR
jgi:hypothetical protein